MRTPMKVLLVEDNKIAQKIPILILRDYHAQVIVAETGAEALTLVKTDQYDIILMDIGLPDMGGEIVAREIRNIEGPNKLTPIVALTAHIDQGQQTGVFTEFLRKPFLEEQCSYLYEKYLNDTVNQKIA